MYRKQSVRCFAALPVLALFCVLTLTCTNMFHDLAKSTKPKTRPEDASLKRLIVIPKTVYMAGWTVDPENDVKVWAVDGFGVASPLTYPTHFTVTGDPVKMGGAGGLTFNLNAEGAATLTVEVVSGAVYDTDPYNRNPVSCGVWVAEPLIREMVWVPGTGTDPNTGGFQYSASGSDVALITNGFKMGKYEVTQKQYEAVMGYNPSYHQGSSRLPAPGEAQRKRPVEMVSWYEAIAFCNKLSVMEGREPAYRVMVNGTPIDWAALDCGESKWTAMDYGWGRAAEITDVPTGTLAEWNAATIVLGANGYRLPTEFEWEWAAMGANVGGSGTNTDGYLKGYAGSAEGAGQNNAAYYAWYYDNSGDNYTSTNQKTHEVGRRLPNELGLYDMSGNVWEWVWNWYGSGESNGNPGSYGSDAAVRQPDYRGAASGLRRVNRGGSWIYDASHCAVAYRSYYIPESRHDDVGFRVVCP